MRLSHSFSVEYAEEYGVECAILINHFQFWIEQNQATGKHFHDGKTWMYQSHKDIASVYPYWSEDTIGRLLQKLENFGVIVKGNYNKSKFDKTTWYAFKDENMFTKPRYRKIVTKISQNQDCETALPIPDTKPNTKEVVVVVNAQAREEENIKKLVVKLMDNKGNDIEARLEDYFEYAVRLNKPWSTEEIEDAWEILCQETPIVMSNWKQLMDGIIKNRKDSKENVLWNQKKEAKTYKSTLKKSNESSSANVMSELPLQAYKPFGTWSKESSTS